MSKEWKDLLAHERTAVIFLIGWTVGFVLLAVALVVWGIIGAT